MMGISSKLNKTDINVTNNIVDNSFVFEAKQVETQLTSNLPHNALVRPTRKVDISKNI